MIKDNNLSSQIDNFFVDRNQRQYRLTKREDIDANRLLKEIKVDINHDSQLFKISLSLLE